MIVAGTFTIGMSAQANVQRTPQEVDRPQSGLSIISVNVESEPAAKALLASALQSLGGGAEWNRLRRVQTEVKSDAAHDTVSRTGLLLDDWSGEETIYRRAAKGATSRVQVHEGSDFVRHRKGAKDVVIKEFDQARVLADHMPGAALAVLMKRSSYVMLLTRPDQCPKPYNCVDVYRREAQGQPPIMEERWVLEAQTARPLRIWLALPNLRSTGFFVWERIAYRNFEDLGGPITPKDLYLSFGSNIETHLHVARMTNAAGTTNSEFDAEVRQ